MKKYIILFIFALFLTAGSAYGMCCPKMFGAGHQYCPDGTVTWGCCGKGSCYIDCCHCDGGCRVPSNCGQWNQYCQGQADICKLGCTGTTDPQDCKAACQREGDSCKRNCPVERNGTLNKTKLRKHFKESSLCNHRLNIYINNLSNNF